MFQNVRHDVSLRVQDEHTGKPALGPSAVVIAAPVIFECRILNILASRVLTELLFFLHTTTSKMMS